jgi:hypothetical protein
MAPRLLAAVKIDPHYPRPLTQRDMDWIADLLSVFAAEFHKGEHRDGGVLFIHEPPKAYQKSLAYEGLTTEPHA